MLRLLTRQGHLVEEEGVTYVADAHGIIDPENLFAPLQAASCTYRIAFGPRAGRKVLSLQYAASRAAPMTQSLCANDHGFSLHAGVRGGKLRIIAAIEEPAVIGRILTHLGLSAQPPPRTPARRVDLFQAA